MSQQQTSEQLAAAYLAYSSKSQDLLKDFGNQIQDVEMELKDRAADQSSQREECSGINPTGHSFISDVSGLSIEHGFDVRKQPSNGEPSLN